MAQKQQTPRGRIDKKDARKIFEREFGKGRDRDKDGRFKPAKKNSDK
ncbi:MAG: hypothetical protein Kow0032_28790 [Methyloligellaceae bacterium]